MAHILIKCDQWRGGIKYSSALSFEWLLFGVVFSLFCKRCFLFLRLFWNLGIVLSQCRYFASSFPASAFLYMDKTGNCVVLQSSCSLLYMDRRGNCVVLRSSCSLRKYIGIRIILIYLWFWRLDDPWLSSPSPFLLSLL